MQKLAAIQSNFLPWKGYFELIDSVDQFVLLDSVQYTKGDWRNRNRIKSPSGTRWLTLPVSASARESIYKAKVTDDFWAKEVEKTLRNSYFKSPFFEWAHERIMQVLDECSNYKTLSEINMHSIQSFSKLLSVFTPIEQDRNFSSIAGKNERLIQICIEANANVYVSGPSAKNYLDESLFKLSGIEVEWFEYKNYPKYDQLWGEFEDQVSIVDLLYNCGPNSSEYIRGIN